MKNIFLATIAALYPLAGLAEFAITDPWARASILSSRPAAAHLTFESDVDDRLVSITTPIAETATIHAVETGSDGGARMTAVEALDLPAGQPVKFRPKHIHIMLMGLTNKLEEGTSFQLTLRFETAGEVTLDVPVLGIAATEPEEIPQ